MGTWFLVKNFRKNSGFTLTELLVTMGISLILMQTVVVQYEVYSIRAKRSEAYQNFHVINALLQGFSADASISDKYYLQLTQLYTTEDISTPTSCNVSNPIGFRAENCKNFRYYYQIGVWQLNGSEQLHIGATEIVYNNRRTLAAKCADGSLDHLHYYLKDKVVEVSDDVTKSCF